MLWIFDQVTLVLSEMSIRKVKQLDWSKDELSWDKKISRLVKKDKKKEKSFLWEKNIEWQKALFFEL